MTYQDPVDNLPAGTPVSRFTKAQRQYYYAIVATVIPILAASSAVVEGQAQNILLVVMAVLGLTGGATAASNAVPLPKP